MTIDLKILENSILEAQRLNAKMDDFGIKGVDRVIGTVEQINAKLRGLNTKIETLLESVTHLDFT